MGGSIVVEDNFLGTAPCFLGTVKCDTEAVNHIVRYPDLLATDEYLIMTVRKMIALLPILCIALAANAQVVDEKLRAELLEMRDRDQKARSDCNKGTTHERMKCYASMSESVDKPNMKRLNEIYNSIGFPDAQRVGKDGVHAYYLILQHSSDIVLKQKSLPGITKAFEEKHLSPSDYANFTDRLLVNQGKPQVYGTNFDFKDNKLVMSKTEDLKNLDERRKKIGLMPIAEYAKILKDLYIMDVVVPEMQ